VDVRFVDAATQRLAASWRTAMGRVRQLLVVLKGMKRDVLKIGVSETQRVKLRRIAVFINGDRH
jgi:hypothetical protein